MSRSPGNRRRQNGTNTARRIRQLAPVVCAAAIGVLLLTACGGSSSSSSPASTSGSTAAQSSSGPTINSGAAGVIPSQKAIAPAQKRLAVISCAQASDCALDANGAHLAAQALGWSSTVFDGQGNPSLYNGLLRNAVNGGYNGIVEIALPLTTASDGLRYAQQHHVPVIMVGGTPADVGNPLVNAVQPLPWTAQGLLIGKWLVSDSQGKAKVLIIRDDEFAGIKLRQDAVAATLAKCSGCKVLGQVRETIAKLTNPTAVSQLIQSSLAQYGSSLQYIVLPFGTVDGLVAPVLAAQGRSDVKIASYDGNKQQLTLCRQNRVNAIAASGETWQGWAAVDKLIRIFNHEPTGSTATPTFLVTSGHCPAAPTAEEANTFNYQSAYMKIWK